jgi:YVTN family beta-propeller protein
MRAAAAGTYSMRRFAVASIAAAMIAAALAAAAAMAAAPGYHIERRIALADGGWDLVSFDPILRRAYIARPDAVTAIAADSGAVLARLAPTDHGHAVVPLRRGAEVLVTDGGDNTARIFDARTGAELARITVGEKPDAAVRDPATGLVAVMNAKSGTVSLIDPATRKLVGEIAVGGALEMAAPDGAGRLFVNIENQNALAVIDLKARKVTGRIALTGCEGPTGVAWLPRARRVLSSCGDGVAAVVDPAAGKVETLPIGAGPDSVIYDGRRHLAFVPAGRSGELDIFADGPGGVRPMGKLATQLGARTGAVDEASGRLYLPAADYVLPVPPGQRPQMKPGSVVVLVVAP